VTLSRIFVTNLDYLHGDEIGRPNEPGQTACSDASARYRHADSEVHGNQAEFAGLITAMTPALHGLLQTHPRKYRLDRRILPAACPNGAFVADTKTVCAVVRALEIVSEATRRLPITVPFSSAVPVFYATYMFSSRSGSLGVEKSLELYKRTQS
jgi:hypothetical protein